MKKINKTCLVFILLLVLSIGVIFLPVGFAIRSPEDLIGNYYEVGVTQIPGPYEDSNGYLGHNYTKYVFYLTEDDIVADDNWTSADGSKKINAICERRNENRTGVSENNYCEDGVLLQHSKYWKVVRFMGIDNYSLYQYALIPTTYEEPKFELLCNPEKISIGEHSTCSLKATYYSKLKNIDFNLNIKDYEISDIKAGDDFENLKVEDNNYSLTGKNSMEESDKGKETTIITFRITSQTNKNRLPTHIEIEAKAEGLKSNSVILTEQIRTIDKSRLKEKIGHIDDEKIMNRINSALGVSFGLDE